MPEATVTVGVDLAALPRNTAACEMHWSATGVVVERVDARVDDGAFLSLLERLPTDGKLGLDCPLGWPVAFVGALRAHHDGQPWPARGGSADRRDLVWRATDRWVGGSAGRWPLSVSTDRIGVVALRAAHLLDAWEAAGGTIDRTGLTGPVAEAYPAVARRVWGLAPARSIEELEARLPVRFRDQAARRACETTAHAFDALVAALVARAAALGRTSLPPPELDGVAAVEGWIHVPTCSLEGLVET